MEEIGYINSLLEEEASRKTKAEVLCRQDPTDAGGPGTVNIPCSDLQRYAKKLEEAVRLQDCAAKAAGRFKLVPLAEASHPRRLPGEVENSAWKERVTETETRSVGASEGNATFEASCASSLEGWEPRGRDTKVASALPRGHHEGDAGSARVKRDPNNGGDRPQASERRHSRFDRSRASPSCFRDHLGDHSVPDLDVDMGCDERKGSRDHRVETRGNADGGRDRQSDGPPAPDKDVEAAASGLGRIIGVASGRPLWEAESNPGLHDRTGHCAKLRGAVHVARRERAPVDQRILKP